MMDQNKPSPLFTETQRFDQLWVRALCVLIFAICATTLHALATHQLPVPVRGLLFAAFALGMAAMALGMVVTVGLLLSRLQTTLDAHHLQIRLWPITKTFPLHSLTRWQAVTYDALNEYGGWGIRRKFGDRSTTAYTTSGDRGVMIERNDGTKILVGSKMAERLEAALTKAREHQ